MSAEGDQAMRLRSALLLALGALAITGAGEPQRAAKAGIAAARDIGASDPLRRTLLDMLRPTIERDVGQKVQFVVRVLRVQGPWAFAHVVPQTKAGAPIDYRRTRYAELIREGMFDGPDTFALLELRKGRWALRAFVTGPTDVTYAGWQEEFGAPNALFGLPEE
jgi:hypothetical protein